MILGPRMGDAKTYIEKRIERIPFCGCWIWLRGRMTTGYGSIRVGKKHKYAHRASLV